MKKYESIAQIPVVHAQVHAQIVWKGNVQGFSQVFFFI